MLEKIERWVSKLPEVERGMPILEVGGVVYTPLDILEEVRAGTELGERLQERWEEIRRERALHNDEAMYEVARLRLIQRYRERPAEVMVLTPAGTEVISAEQLIREVEEGTNLGSSLVRAECKVIQRLIRA